jgi:hypothetical protein
MGAGEGGEVRERGSNAQPLQAMRNCSTVWKWEAVTSWVASDEASGCGIGTGLEERSGQ